MLLKFASAIITCEHAGNNVPDDFQSLFINASEILQSHRGWDPGAFEIANHLATKKSLPFFFCNTTRLLIEANRSIHHPELFSDYTRSLSDKVKEEIKYRYYFPYRDSVELAIQSLPKPVLHLSMHTFTPVLHDIKRTTDIGLLFDPARTLESTSCTHICEKLSRLLPAYQIDFNKPYAGTDDGFTTYLRTKFLNDDYAGIEIEVNQKFSSGHDQQKISTALDAVLTELLH